MRKVEASGIMLTLEVLNQKGRPKCYAAAIWTKALSVKAYKRKLQAGYCLSPLRISNTFRIMLSVVVFVVSQMILVDILAKEMRRLYHSKVPTYLRKSSRQCTD